MEDQGDAGRPRSDSKLAGKKRTSGELKEKSEVARKKIKMHELESLLGSEEASSSRLKNKEDNDHFQLSEQMYQVTSVTVTLDLDAYQAERRGRTTLSVEVTTASRPLDLNSEACIANNLVRNDIAEHADNCNEVPLLKKHEDKHGNKCVNLCWHWFGFECKG